MKVITVFLFVFSFLLSNCQDFTIYRSLNSWKIDTQLIKSKNITSVIIESMGKNPSVNEFTFDTVGRLIRFEEKINSRTQLVQKYDYSVDGNKIIRVDSSEYTNHTFIYEFEGNLLKYVTFFKETNDTINTQKFFYEDNKLICKCLNNRCQYIKYDSVGRISEVHDNDGFLISKYVYSNNGKECQIYNYDISDCIMKYSGSEYIIYDSEGRNIGGYYLNYKGRIWGNYKVDYDEFGRISLMQKDKLIFKYTFCEFGIEKMEILNKRGKVIEIFKYSYYSTSSR